MVYFQMYEINRVRAQHGKKKKKQIDTVKTNIAFTTQNPNLNSNTKKSPSPLHVSRVSISTKPISLNLICNMKKLIDTA